MAPFRVLVKEDPNAGQKDRDRCANFHLGHDGLFDDRIFRCAEYGANTGLAKPLAAGISNWLARGFCPVPNRQPHRLWPVMAGQPPAGPNGLIPMPPLIPPEGAFSYLTLFSGRHEFPAVHPTRLGLSGLRGPGLPLPLSLPRLWPDSRPSPARTRQTQ